MLRVEAPEPPHMPRRDINKYVTSWNGHYEHTEGILIVSACTMALTNINSLCLTAAYYFRYFAPWRVAKYCDVYVCLSVHSHISEITRPNFFNFFLHIACGRGLVLLWWHYDMLCTSGFVDGVMFLHNGPYGASRIFLIFILY